MVFITDAGDPRDRAHDPVREPRRARRHHGHLASTIAPIATRSRVGRAHPRQDRPARRPAGRQWPREIEEKYGIPIVNRRVSVTPIAGCVGSDDPAALRRGGARARRRRRRDRHRLRRRLQRHGAEGLHARRRGADRGYSRGDQRHAARVLVGQRRLARAPASTWTPWCAWPTCCSR